MSSGRACDQCRRRKIKCIATDGLNKLGCQNCTNASLPCTYETVPLKKGPKGSKASVLHELKQPRRSPLSQDALRDTLAIFFSKLYYVLPIIDKSELSRIVDLEQVTLERYCLILSMCSMVYTQVLDRSADELIRVTLRTRQAIDYVETPTLDSVHISFFLFATFFGRNIHNTAWFYLREAITFAQLIGLDNEESYKNIASCTTAGYRRRTFWVLYVTERAYAIQRHHSLSMQPTIDLPSLANHDTQQDDDLTGFRHMVELWSKIDIDFLTLWNDTRRQVSADYMVNLHSKLQDALPYTLDIPEVQRVDILISQQWLRVIIWQLSTSRMLLSSTASETSLQFTFPVLVCRDLLQITSSTTHDVLRVHGLGLVEKLFEIASTLVDVIVCDLQLTVHAQTPEAPRYLAEVLKLMRLLRPGRNPWTAILEDKIKQSLPGFDLGADLSLKADDHGQSKAQYKRRSLSSPQGGLDNGLEWPSARIKREQ